MLATARAKGDARPQWILAVTATAAEAQRALGDPGGPAPTGNLVYLVYVKGHRFTLGGPPVLPGEPTGQYLLFAIDAATLQDLSVALGTRPPDVPLASFGPVSVLYGAVSLGPDPAGADPGRGGPDPFRGCPGVEVGEV